MTWERLLLAAYHAPSSGPAGGINVVGAYRPRNITEVLQTDHFEIAVSAAARTINVRKLTI